MKDKVGRKGDNGYRYLRKEEGSSEEGPEMTEICEQGTLLLFVPTMSGPAEKKKPLQSECARNVGERKALVLLPWGGKEKGA